MLDENIKKQLDILPKNIEIAYSIQYKKLAEQIKSYLQVKRIFQVLGCSEIQTKSPLLLVSDGSFHATNPNLKEIYLLDMSARKISIINYKETKGKYLKFLSSNNIGILVSTKPGQNHIKEAIKLKDKLNKKGKKSYILIGDEINNLENFSFDSYINTACPRLDLLNYKEI